MGDTEISWTHRPGTRARTWNPVQGCSRISEGCRNCYAERLAARFAENGWSKGLINLSTKKWNGTVRLAAHKLAEPLGWREPSTVFANSMSDLFHDGFTNEEIAAVFGVMAAAPHHTFQVLTKRAARMREWFAWLGEHGDTRALRRCGDAAQEAGARVYDRTGPAYVGGGVNQARSPWNNSLCRWPLPNVWLGVSVENQDAADERIPELLKTPAAIRFLSCEPLIGPVDLEHVRHRLGESSFEIGSVLEGNDGFGLSAARNRIDQVIAGCESGPGARPCDVAWLRSLRDQCARAGRAYFLKQAAATDLGRCGDADNPNGDSPCGERITAYVVSPSTASYSCGCCVEGSEDGTCVPLGPGDGSKRKSGGVIELPYLDGVQHAAFPEVARG